MPAILTALLLLIRIQEQAFVDCFVLHRTNDTDLVIGAAVWTPGINDRMDMQSRGAGLARELTKALG